MERIVSSLPLIAHSDLAVLLQGETGVGKEVMARRLHSLSKRGNAPFVKVNCTALPTDLLESELFGHERGAFTGAVERRLGAFELAQRGTLFLDEIGDMHPKLQAKMLHAIEDKEFRRVGGHELVRVNVRVIAATNRDLRGAIARNEFREDLYYRLNVIELRIPPLRERRDEIPALATELMKKHAGASLPVQPLTLEIIAALTAYDWPGNIRQLENVMRRYLVYGNAEQIISELSQSEAIAEACLKPAEGASLSQLVTARKQAESEAIVAALKKTCWHRKQAAVILGIPYKTLLYKMKRLNLGQKRSQFVAAD